MKVLLVLLVLPALFFSCEAEIERPDIDQAESRFEQLDNTYSQIDLRAAEDNFPAPKTADFLDELENDLRFFDVINSENVLIEDAVVTAVSAPGEGSRVDCYDPTMIFLPAECVDVVEVEYEPNGVVVMNIIMDFDGGILSSVSSYGNLSGWIWDNFTQTSWSSSGVPFTNSFVVQITGVFSSGGNSCTAFFDVSYDSWTGNWTVTSSGC